MVPPPTLETERVAPQMATTTSATTTRGPEKLYTVLATGEHITWGELADRIYERVEMLEALDASDKALAEAQAANAAHMDSADMLFHHLISLDDLRARTRRVEEAWRAYDAAQNTLHTLYARYRAEMVGEDA